MREISFEDFIKELTRMENKALTNIEVGVNEALEDLLSLSQQLAPIDEGGLMENGSVDPAINRNGEISGRVGYNKEYALRMHEDFYNLGETSSQKPNVDGMKVGRKYLSNPLNKNSNKYVNHLGEKLEDALNG